eukprot:2558825-Amphidinium_carterae.1
MPESPQVARLCGIHCVMSEDETQCVAGMDILHILQLGGLCGGERKRLAQLHVEDDLGTPCLTVSTMFCRS